jgi:O-antigen/teichoic acid export membrane protein
MSAIFNRAITSNFVQSMGVLMIGTILGQSIYFLSIPVLTRFYEPSVFAEFALFTALVAAIAPVIAGRYEMALIVVNSEEDRSQLLNISILLAVLTSLTCSIIFGILKSLDLVNEFKFLGFYLYLVPAALFFTAIISILRCYSFARHQLYKVAQISVFQPTLMAGFAISFGWIGLQSGLLMATLASLL